MTAITFKAVEFHFSPKTKEEEEDCGELRQPGHLRVSLPGCCEIVLQPRGCAWLNMDTALKDGDVAVEPEPRDFAVRHRFSSSLSL